MARPVTIPAAKNHRPRTPGPPSRPAPCSARLPARSGLAARIVDSGASTWRKRISLQFLYGINYIHHKGLLHRDVSLQNVMLKVFDGGAVLVKLSDFGLVKDRTSEFTRTSTEMRGTIRDPMLSSFKDYAVVNEIYSLGFVLCYIFTGRKSLKVAVGDVGKIVEKCVANDTAQRYRRVIDLIADVEGLAVSPADASA